MTARSSRRSFVRRLAAAAAAALALGAAPHAPALAGKPGGDASRALAAPTAPAVPGKLSVELQPLLNSPGTLPADAAWARRRDDLVYVKVLIVAASTDPELLSLRTDILTRGGSVFYNYLSVRAVSALLPASALGPLSARDDVLNIAPNRAATRQVSLVQAGSGAGDALPGAGTPSAFDGKGVGIAVLDSGIDFRHRNFVATDGTTRVRRSIDIAALGRSFQEGGWAGGLDYSASARTFIDGTKLAQGAKEDLPYAAVPDAYGHGTAVAGIAAGNGGYQSPDGGGIAPGANLYDVRVLNEQGVGNTADVLLGIDWVLQRARIDNIRVMNLSLGAASTDSFLVDPLARAARSAVAAGLVVVASAGNAGKDSSGRELYGAVSSPAHEPSVITVGADNLRGTADRADDAITTFSSRGPTRGGYTFASGTRWSDNLIKPDLVAPGNKVLTALGADAAGTWNLLARTYPDLAQVSGASQAARQTVMTLSGTSLAAPAVAGAAAVLLQANPGLTPPLVKAILQYSATPLAGANLLQQGTGALNVEGALRLARALRTDIAPALAAGTLKPGDNLLAAGQVMPTPASTIAGRTQTWSRIAYAGGNHLVRGDALFTSFQPIWDPALTWARHYTLRSTVSWLPATNRLPGFTVPMAIVERNAAAQPLLGAGVKLLDAVATSASTANGSAALMMPLTTLIARADSGLGLMLGSGFATTGSAIQADGLTLSQGFILNEGFILTEGFILNEGFILREGFILNEGFILTEGFILNEGFILREGFILNEGFILRESGGDAAGTSDGSFRGD
ncbi:MAG: S8 family serine peptidase [Burkholderiaceae bacterium]